MPTVPTLNPQVRPAQFGGAHVSQGGGPSVEGVGRGLTAIGQAVERGRLQADRTAVLGADAARDTWANDRLYNPETGAFTQKGGNALGVTQNVLSEFDDQVTQTAKTLTTPRQQQAYLESSVEHRANLQSLLLRHENEQRTQFEDDTATARVITAAQSGALSYNDPATLARSRDDIVSTIDGQAKIRGWSDEQTQVATMRGLGELHGGVIERMLADKQTGMASKYLDANKGELSADDQLKFSRAIETAQREGRNELEAAMRGQISDLSASYKAGLPVPKGQELTAGQLDAVFPGKGAEIHASLEADKRMGYALKDINQQSPEDVAKTLDSYNVTQGGAGAKDALDRQNDVRRAALESFQARKKDPAQFAVDNGLGYNPLPADPQGISAELKNREAIRPSVSKKVGFLVPMLTPAEAKQMGTQLDSADADKALQSFDFLRSTLGDQSYQAVMQQIAPDSPVKAYAGQIYGRKTPVTVATHAFSPDEQVEQRVISATMVTGENLVNKSKAQLGADGKPIKSLLIPDKATFDSQFADAVGSAFANNPDGLNLAQQAAYAYYVGESAQTGRLSNDKDNIKTANVLRAIHATVGDKVDFHGYGDVLPPLGVDRDSFESGLRSRYVAEMESRGVSRDDALNAWPDLGVVNVRGGYMLTHGRAPFSIKGQPVVIDLNSVLPVAPPVKPLEDVYTPQ